MRVHAKGQPINHSTHGGFNAPPTVSEAQIERRVNALEADSEGVRRELAALRSVLTPPVQPISRPAPVRHVTPDKSRTTNHVNAGGVVAKTAFIGSDSKPVTNKTKEQHG